MSPRKLLTLAILITGFSTTVPAAANADPAQPDGGAKAKVAVATSARLAAARGTIADAGPFAWINQRSPKCLDQDWSGGVQHADVLAWTCNGAANQYWYLTALSDGTFRLMNYRSGRCLDQDWSGGRQHSDVIAWPCNGSLNQFWF